MKAMEAKEIADANSEILLPDLLPVALETIYKLIEKAAKDGNHYVAFVTDEEPEFVIKAVLAQLENDRFNVQAIPNIVAMKKVYEVLISWEAIKENTLPIGKAEGVGGPSAG